MGIRKILWMDIGSGAGPKPLTFQKTLSVLLFITCIFLLLPGYLGEKTDKTLVLRQWGWAFFFSSVAFSGWHIWATSSKRNIYPDVLSMIFKPKAIFEASGIQFLFLMSQMRDEIRIATIIQNMHDSVTTTQMDFALQFSKNANRIALPSLKHELGPSHVTLAQYRFPLSTAQMQKKYAKITPTVRTHITEPAQVRFDRRQVFDTKMKPWLSFLMLAGPVAVFGGGRFFTLRLSPVTPESRSQTPPKWAFRTLWSPVMRKTGEEIMDIIDSETSGEQ